MVIGGLMHARPKFFAKVMGELLFWVGEDKMLFGSDYAIWEPKWQVEGLVDWEMPDDAELADFPRLGVEGKKKILGLNGAKLYGVEVPEELRLPVPADEPARRRAPWESPGEPALPSPRGARDGLRPGARRADHHARLRRLLVVTDEGDVAVRLRLPTPQCAPNFAFLMAADARAAVRRLAGWGPSRSCSRTTTRARRSTPRSTRRRASTARSRARPRASWTRCASCSSARRCVARQARLCEALLAAGPTRRSWRCAGRPARRRRGERVPRAAGARSGCPATRDAPAFVAGDGSRR